MKRNKSLLLIAGLALVLVGNLSAQVGKSLGVVDVNIAPEKDLLTFPHMTPAIVKGVIEKRPFNSITDLNAYLLSQGVSAPQAMEFYTKAFVHINLNTAPRDEILLVPGAGNRMAREFAEYRPWKTWAQFDKEIGKYVGQEATDKLKQYCFIPLNLNTATDEESSAFQAQETGWRESSKSIVRGRQKRSSIRKSEST